MAQLVLNIDTIVDIPNQPFTAQLTRVMNSIGHDITAIFTTYCATEGLGLSTQAEIESAVNMFMDAYKDNSSVLP